MAAMVLSLAFGTAATVDAQERTPAGGGALSEVRVVKDQTTIWNRNPSTVLAVVKAGTVLRAVAREDRWIEVLVPPKEGGKGNTGFVLAAHVEHVAGTPDIPLRQSRRGDSMWDASGEPRRRSARAPAPPPPAIGVRGFGIGSYGLFQARDSFEAIFESAWQPFYGGGAQVVLFDKLFVEGSFEQFKRTGQRVVVSDGEVFPLGIEDRVTINPITVSAGYRFRSAATVVSYAGGGVGSYRLRETSEFADPSENVDERHTSYHALGGVEVGVTRWVFTAFEVQYTSVPDALGIPGVSGEFGETNLGGLSLRIKVLVGR
jgi:opacity protein-like surface antigen